MSGVMQWKRATPWDPQPLSPKNFPPIIVAALVESLLYGIHLILFIICLALLLTRHLRLQRLMLFGLVCMLGLSTADIALTWKFLVREPGSIVRGTTVSFLERIFPKFMIYVSNNLIAVTLLIARCYVVWGQRWYIAVGFGVPLLAGTGLGYASQISNPDFMRRSVPVFIIITLVLNNVLTILTAARIWWLSRRVSTALGRKRQTQYRTTSAIIIESGFVYSASLLVLIGLSSTIWVGLGGAIVLRLVGITPIMIFVQIAVGHATYPAKGTELTTGIQGTHDYTYDRGTEARTNTVILDTIHSSRGGGGAGESSMQLTSHASSMAGDDVGLDRK